MDEADHAQIQIDAQLAAGLARVRRRAPVLARSVCMDCDDEIPAARAQLGVETCIDCQELRDEYGKHYRR